MLRAFEGLCVECGIKPSTVGKYGGTKHCDDCRQYFALVKDAQRSRNG